MVDNLQIEYELIETISIQKNATLYKDGIKILPYTTNIPAEYILNIIEEYTQRFNTDIPSGQLITVTSVEFVYNIDYEIANNYKLSFQKAADITEAIINLNVQNIPLNKCINVRINNSNGNKIMFNTHEVISQSETSVYNIVFKNPAEQIVLYGTKIEEFK